MEGHICQFPLAGMPPSLRTRSLASSLYFGSFLLLGLVIAGLGPSIEVRAISSSLVVERQLALSIVSQRLLFHRAKSPEPYRSSVGACD